MAKQKPISQRFYDRDSGLLPEELILRKQCYERFETRYSNLALVKSQNIHHQHSGNYGGPNRTKGSRQCIVCDALAEVSRLNDHDFESLWVPDQPKIPRFYGLIAVMHPYFPQRLPQSELVCVRFLDRNDSWYYPGKSTTIFIGPPDLMEKHLPTNDYMLDRQEFVPVNKEDYF